LNAVDRQLDLDLVAGPDAGAFCRSAR